MNDPHIESLTYRMKAVPGAVSFENPPPVDYETPAFRSRLERGLLIVEMKEHYATAQEARARVESFLRDWTLFSALDFDSVPMEFVLSALTGSTAIRRRKLPDTSRRRQTSLSHQ